MAQQKLPLVSKGEAITSVGENDLRITVNVLLRDMAALQRKLEVALRPRAREVFMVKVTGSESGGGKYTGCAIEGPTASAVAEGNLTEAEIGTVTGGRDCLILNTREVGKSTHDLESSGFLPLIFLGWFIGLTTDDKPIVAIDGFQWEDCT